MTKEIRLPGGPFISFEADIIQAIKTIKHGFKNSEGCKDANPRAYHRVAPLPKSVPNIGRNRSPMNEKIKPIIANRLTKSTDIIDMIIIVDNDSAPKTICLST